MAVTDFHAPSLPTFGRILTAPFRGVWAFLTMISETNSHVRKVEALQMLSDEQLAAKGLTREQIVHYVFRDYLHI